MDVVRGKGGRARPNGRSDMTASVVGCRPRTFGLLLSGFTSLLLSGAATVLVAVSLVRRTLARVVKPA